MQKLSRAAALTHTPRPRRHIRALFTKGTALLLLFVFLTGLLHGNWLSALVWMGGGVGLWMLLGGALRYRARAAMLREVDTLTEADFIRYMTDLLQAQGYAVHPMGPPTERRVDCLLTRGKEHLVCRFQQHDRYVGESAVVEALAAMETQSCEGALVVTNRAFTRRARLLARREGCVLIDREALANLVTQYRQGHRVLAFQRQGESIGKRVRKKR